MLHFGLTIKCNRVMVNIVFFFKDRIAKGEKNVLTSQEPWMLAVTSGTTGKSCLIPKTRDNSKTFVEYGFAVGVYYTMYNVLPQVSGHTSINANIGYLKNVVLFIYKQYSYRQVQ